jgi:hypothetical protein
MKKPYWLPGNVAEIEIPGPFYCYGIVIASPLMGFFDIRSDKHLTCDLLSGKPLAFRVWVMKYAIGKNGWKIIGQLPLSDEMKDDPWFFKKDRISGKLTKYRHNDERPASKEECLGLECAAVWDPEHIVSRLDDHFESRPNKWAEAMKIK